jgi:plastocyanin
MRTKILLGAALIAVTAWSCSSSPASPSVGKGNGDAGGGGGATTINILGADGNGSFLPSPASIPQGSAIVWTNTDSEVHRVVATDNSFDTGELAPGGTSAAIVLSTDGANYYCAIHPAELGSINASNGAPPPCTSPHCGR